PVLSTPSLHDALPILGFSLGTALALDYADSHRDDPQLRGLILLSPALVAGNPYAWLSPYVRWVRAWTGNNEEMDAARYRTMSLKDRKSTRLNSSHVKI